MNTSILDTKMLRIEARRHMIHAANVFYEGVLAQDPEPEPETWVLWLASLNEVGRAALREAIDELPNDALFLQYARVDDQVRWIFNEASFERDQLWLARARSWLIDSRACAREADFDEAIRLIERARDGLIRVLGRERNSPRTNRMLTRLAATQLQSVLSRLESISAALQAGRRVLA